MNNDLSTLPPPPKGQSGINPSQFSHLPPPPKGQQGMTLAQIQGQQPAQQSQGILSKIGGSISSAFKSGVGQIKQGIQQGQSATNPLQAVESGITAGAGMVNTAFSPLAPITSPIMKGISQSVSNDPITDNPTYQKFAMGKMGQNVARGAEDVGNLAAIAGAGAGAVEAPRAAGALADTGQGLVAGAKQGLSDTADRVRASGQEYAVNSLKADWMKPVTENKAGFTKPTAIFNNAKAGGHNIADTLANSGVKLSDNVEQGRYNTNDTAETIRDDAGKMSSELLRPSLEAANFMVERTPVVDVLKSAARDIVNNKTLTAENKTALIGKLKQTGPELQKQYPDGLSLTDLHDEKILRSANAKFSPVGDISTNLEANKNFSISSALKKTLESKAPEGIPVKEFNGELRKQYQTADYLDSLHGKTVPRSLGQKVAQTTAKVVGAAVGDHLGGGILGGVGGYHLGGMLERTFENMSNPVKAHFLNNLEQTNPEAFVKVKDALGEMETARLQQKRLPAPSYIPMGPKTVESGVRSVTAKKNPVSMNPKTGKFQTSYNSTP